MRNTQLQGFRYPSKEELTTLSACRHALLEPAYQAYLQAPARSDPPKILPSLELLPTSEIDVKINRCEKSEGVARFTVTKVSDPSAINFMGYHRGESCLVFRGEARLFNDFLEFAMQAVNVKAIDGLFQAPAGIHCPSSGLESGLSYNEFAARVEIVEYVLVVDHTTDDEDAPNAVVEADQSRCHSPTSPRFPPTPGVNYTLSDLLGVDLKEPTPNILISDMKKSGYETPSKDSDSSLSPPPEIIVTPPSMKRSSFSDRLYVGYNSFEGHEGKGQEETQIESVHQKKADHSESLYPPSMRRSRRNR